MTFYSSNSDFAITIKPVIKKHKEQVFASSDKAIKTWLLANNFTAKSGELCLCANEKGELVEVYLGMDDRDDFEAFAKAALALPPGIYQFVGELKETQALYWALAQYQFMRYKKKKTAKRKCLLVTHEKCASLEAMVGAITLARDLINMPCENMGPSELAQVCEKLAREHKAEYKQINGEALLKENFPAIYAVGRAAAKAPCFIELNWGEPDAPLLCLVGKGVCFDSGGLDIKSSSNMRLMKKDMGGAAHVIALAKLIMQEKLPVRLQVLIPAVENAISGNAYRPGDILKTRKGISVEVGNTDAEGRLVLSDALAYAAEKKPVLIIDFATLTGAARVALGADIAALFTNNDDFAVAMEKAAKETQDPIWRLPLYKPYLKLIQPSVADLTNSAASGYGGAITAALFLEQFVNEIPFAHFDVMAWNTTNKPGRPKGGEVLALRALFHYLKTHFV